ncbi:MAG TPA: PQQ-dependent sugar dehydrogenase [Pyrinomonadaceae bacterium]|nr:PQQ-dependent sugar dehydrogenase [Pyrinomonadaceae bacterium]
MHSFSVVCATVLFVLSFSFITRGATLPEGFTETRLAEGLSGATAMAFAPDGRLFVCQQDGRVRIVKDGELLPTPFVTVGVDQTGERGLLGIAFDPDFLNNRYVYLYYTVNTSPRYNRVSRVTAGGDTAVAGSEVLIFRLDDLSSATVHNGGAMHFGADGKLYIATGENASPANSQTLSSLSGKLLRINADGTIPPDNPFFHQATGNARAIWAQGLRNPFTFAFQAGTNRLYINDVGQDVWEEINEGAAGANYGWPNSEGATDSADERGPVFAYAHGSGANVGCAITGGAFYNPPARQFPEAYAGRYFFADYCSGWIRALNPPDNTVADFANGIALPVALETGPDGALYYLARGADALYRIEYTGDAAPAFTAQPEDLTVAEGAPATLTVEASGGRPLTFRWLRNGVEIAGATASAYTLNPATRADDGAQFQCIVTNAKGSATSRQATLRVVSNMTPVANITQPSAATLYRAGDVIQFSGHALDAEDGELPASAFTWRVDFHHDTHSHPFMAETEGVRAGSFNIPATGETSANVWYRVHLRVVDSVGLAHETFRDVHPRKANVTLNTSPAGLQIKLDGQPFTSPLTFAGVAGMQRSIGVVPVQDLNGVTYDFQTWSDDGALTHDIETPDDDATYTALFVAREQHAPSVIHFGAPTYQISEGAASVQINVTRSGDASAPVSVQYETFDVTASERSDYITTRGTLLFGAGETSKILTLFLTDDALNEGAESLRLSLTNVAGGASLGNPSIATVTIADDDANAPALGNPVDRAEFFVRQHYLDFLNREPDADGLRFWSNQILECGADARCVRFKREHVSAAFFFSIEFQETGFLVYRLQRAAFAEFPRFRSFVGDTQEIGRGVIVGVGDWRVRLDTNSREFVESFVARPEFVAEFPLSLSDAEYIDKLNERTGFSLSAQERDALVAGLTAGTLTRATALRAIAEDEDFKLRERNRVFVLLQYYGYLRRNPDDPPNTNFDGYNFWLNKLNQHGGNFINAEMVNSFLVSGEYRERFGQP